VYSFLFLLTLLIAQGIYTMSRLARLAEEITEIRGVIESTIKFIESLSQKIEDCECDPGKLDQLINDLENEKERLASAVLANDDVFDDDEEDDDEDEDEEDEDEEDEEDDEEDEEDTLV
jgi:hypothetical protein